jgi:1-acyl-sn-glycerol-3-phosphate acyltransferase
MDMTNSLERWSDQVAESTAKVVTRAFPPVIELARRYFRLEVEGVEHLPSRGGAVIAPNHSGAGGFDAALVADTVLRATGRPPRILSAWSIFSSVPLMERVARRMGCIEASYESGLEALRKNNLLLVFPEGEAGSFKPTSEAYSLKTFRTGFVRMAVEAGKPIIPCVVVGAEESHLNLGRIRAGRILGGAQLPLPLNLLPLPAKWRIRFLPAVDVSAYDPRQAGDPARMEALAEAIRGQVQRAVDRQVADRPYVYFGTNRAESSR